MLGSTPSLTFSYIREWWGVGTTVRKFTCFTSLRVQSMGIRLNMHEVSRWQCYWLLFPTRGSLPEGREKDPWTCRSRVTLRLLCHGHTHPLRVHPISPPRQPFHYTQWGLTFYFHVQVNVTSPGHIGFKLNCLSHLQTKNDPILSHMTDRNIFEWKKTS